MSFQVYLQPGRSLQNRKIENLLLVKLKRPNKLKKENLLGHNSFKGYQTPKRTTWKVSAKSYSTFNVPNFISQMLRPHGLVPIAIGTAPQLIKLDPAKLNSDSKQILT